MVNAVSGVCGAGLRTTVQPAANAGQILRVAMAAGKFHEVMRTAMPIGCRRTKMRLVPDGDTCVSPTTRKDSSENHRKNSAAYETSKRASVSDLPFSSAMSRANSSDLSVIN